MGTCAFIPETRYPNDDEQMNRREFFAKALAVTATGIFAPEYLVRGRSMVSLCSARYDLVPSEVTAEFVELLRRYRRLYPRVWVAKFGPVSALQ
jgi:hypothetical protein